MQRFSALYETLDQSTATRDKVAAMVAYFSTGAALDNAWALHILTGNKLKRLVPAGVLRTLIGQVSGLPDWLVDETYSHVGDLAETATLLVHDDAPDHALEDTPLSHWTEQLLPGLRRLDPPAQQAQIAAWWRQLPAAQRFVLNKLLTGSLRVGVSRALVVQALAQLGGLERDLIAHRLSGSWSPTAIAWAALFNPPGESVLLDDRPYPFFLASPLEAAPETLGSAADWIAEWKWDGIRAQLIRRGGQTSLWSRGEERLDGRFPEIEAAAAALPEGVYDGEILAWRGEQPLPFAHLQRRIGRLKPGTKMLADYPVVFLAYDLLELHGADCRELSLSVRRERLTGVFNGAAAALRTSPAVAFDDWSALAERRNSARQRGVEGLMLKRLASPYQVGRRRGDWWKWKIDPLTVDAVMIYAQAGHGRRSNLHTDYTFGVWQGDRLVPFAKAYSGLSDEEINRLDRWIRAHTRERFGPVRVVDPVQVFELAFEGIGLSSRHKSGIAVRFPRIARWRDDKTAAQADRLDDLHALLRSLEAAASEAGKPLDGDSEQV